MSGENPQTDRHFWVLVRDPGCVTERKGPFSSQALPTFLRDLFQTRPFSLVDVLHWGPDGPSVTDGPQALMVEDWPSADVARNQINRLEEAHERSATHASPIAWLASAASRFALAQHYGSQDPDYAAAEADFKAAQSAAETALLVANVRGRAVELAVKRVLEARAEYFDRTDGHYDRAQAAGSYRATIKEVGLAVDRAEGIVEVPREIARCHVQEYRKSDGTKDFFAAITVGKNTITPHMHHIRGRAEYEVAEWNWLLNGAPKPDFDQYDLDALPGWTRTNCPPTVGGGYLIGGYVNDGTLPRNFQWTAGSCILTLDGPQWSISDPDKRHIPMSYWTRVPSHPERHYAQATA